MTTTTTTVDTPTVSTTDSKTTEQTTELTPAQLPTVQATGPSGLLNEFKRTILINMKDYFDFYLIFGFLIRFI